MKDIDRITVDLLDWRTHEPTGVIAYCGSEVVDSEYADNVEEFKEFFERTFERMEHGVRLSINLDVHDLCDHTEAITDFARKIRDAFFTVLWERGETV